MTDTAAPYEWKEFSQQWDAKRRLKRDEFWRKFVFENNHKKLADYKVGMPLYFDKKYTVEDIYLVHSQPFYGDHGYTFPKSIIDGAMFGKKNPWKVRQLLPNKGLIDFGLGHICAAVDYRFFNLTHK